MKLARIAAIALLVIAVVSTVACNSNSSQEPTPTPTSSYTHIPFCLSRLSIQTVGQMISIYVEAGKALEGYYTTSDVENSCEGLVATILRPNVEGATPEWKCMENCEGSQEFSVEIDETGYHRVNFAYLNTEDYCDTICIDLYYRVR